MKTLKSQALAAIPTIGSVFIFALLLSLISCDQIGLAPATSEPPPLVSSGTQAIPEALVTFYVEIPADTLADEPILLSVLDEVTGLALNARRYPMEKIDETHYAVALPFKLGSMIKYRYSRQGEILAEEHLTDGRDHAPGYVPDTSAAAYHAKAIAHRLRVYRSSRPIRGVRR